MIIAVQLSTGLAAAFSASLYHDCAPSSNTIAHTLRNSTAIRNTTAHNPGPETHHSRTKCHASPQSGVPQRMTQGQRCTTVEKSVMHHRNQEYHSA
eukprot:1159054-Pelagomonas_calceolata.AAC.19